MRVRKQYGPHAKQCASFTPRPFCLSCLSATHITAKDATRPQKDEKKTEITASHAERVAYSETIASQRLVSREAPDTLKHSPPILAVERVKSTQANQPVSRIHPRGTSTEASETEKREKTEKPTASKTSESRQVKIATLNKWDTSAQTSKAASVTTQEQESPALAPGHSSTQKQTKKKERQKRHPKQSAQAKYARSPEFIPSAAMDSSPPHGKRLLHPSRATPAGFFPPTVVHPATPSWLETQARAYIQRGQRGPVMPLGAAMCAHPFTSP